MNEYLLTIYVMFCIGVGIRSSFEENNLVGRFVIFFFASLFAPLILGYEVTRYLLRK